MAKIDQILAYALERNEFYKSILTESRDSGKHIDRFPVLTREVFQKNKNIILSPEYRVNNLTNHLYRLSSSGTSGVPVETFWDPNQYAKSMLSLWRRRKKYYNVSPSEKHIDFMLKYYNSVPDKKLNYLLSNNTLSINRLNLNDPEVMAHFFEVVNEFKPAWIQLSPSVMEIIINYSRILHKQLPSSIKYIEFMSEMLTPSIRSQAQQLLPKAKISNMYGSEEMNAIAYECPYGKMHIISENVYAECLTETGVEETGEGNIILTNLYNLVTPLIRYDQRDIVKLEPRIKCACGYEDKVISVLKGRTSSMAIVNGKNMSTCDISDIMLIISNKFDYPIKKYKFVFSCKENILICYTLFNDAFVAWRDEIWNTIKVLFEEKYGEMNMKFVMDDYDKGTYKHDLFIVKRTEI